MKSFHTCFLVLAALSALSCVKEVASDPAPSRKVTVRASIPQEQETKISLTTTSNRQALCLAWKQGDLISINGNEFAAGNILSEHEAEFSGDAPSGSEFTIIYPGKYASADAFNARSYVSQKQSGNSSTDHLEYNAILAGVSEYLEPVFTPGWAAAKGGTLRQNGAIQLRLQLPAGVESANSVALIASRAVFPATNAGDVMSDHQVLTLSGCTLPSNRILEAYMMFSCAGVTFQDGDRLTVAVDTPDAMYYRTLDMGGQAWTGGSEYTVQCKVSTPNNFTISDSGDLEAFRDGVNSGSFLWQWRHVTLGNDIDCSSISDWEPIGKGGFVYDGDAANAYEVSGTPFHGTFDGGGYTLYDLQMSGTPAANEPYGFFGILDGATVKDLVFGADAGDGGYLKVTPSAAMEAGIVAGVARGSVLRNITNYSPMSILTNSSTAPAFFGMVGYVMGTVAGGSVLENLDNYGEVNAHGGSNTNNGATGFNVAAIAGFSHTSNSNIRNTIEECDNYGNVTTSTGRAAGILAGANARTQLLGCTNRGNIEDSFSSARLAGICSLLGNNSWMNECSNYGKIIASNSGGQAGGLACLVNQEAVAISGGGNHGLILCDASYRGTLAANFSVFKSVSDVVAGGAIATYSSTAPNHIGSYAIITESNYLDFLGGGLNDEKLATIKSVTFEAWNDYPEGSVTYIADADDLQAFAAAVNSGAAATGTAVLIADIDCSSITSWTPIGNCGMSAWTHVNLTTTGTLFAGTFDGQGHTISNLEMNFASSGSWKAYGFFGGLDDGAVVKDLTFDDSCSMNVSAAYGSSFGVLAGLVKGATIENVVSYATVTGGGTSSLGNNNAAGRTMVGGIIGEVHTGAQVAKLSGLYNYGAIGSSASDFSCGNNAGNGANGFHVGGIAGFSTNTSNTRLVTFTDCHNYAHIYTNAGRSSGLVAACNRYTKLDGCTNRGNVVSSVSGTFRLGNITCIAGVGSELVGCINYGNLTALNCESVAGVMCLVNDASVKLTNCASLGATILGKNVNVSGTQTYNGVLFGQCNKDATFSGCRVSGVIGTSTSSTVTLTAENYFQFVGQASSAATTCTTANITFDGGAATGNGISSAEDLVAFASAFNSGADVSRFLVGGAVKFNNDINASSISQWVPIGTSSRPLNLDVNGNGKTIYNVNWTVDATQAESLGLIGCAESVAVSNLTLGGKDSEIVFSGNRSKIRAGGIIGRAEDVTLSNVVNNASLKVTGTSASGNNLILGGLVGYADPDCTIGGNAGELACVNNGNVTATVVGQLGGIVGYNSGFISHCTNKGNVTCPSSGSYGPAWLCSHNTTKSRLTDNYGYGLVGGSPAMIRNAVKEDIENKLDPESVTVDWTLDAYYDWTQVESINLHSGATYRHYSCTNVPRQIHVLEVDLTNPGIELTAALAGEIVPNPNGLIDNDHNYELNTIRERLSDVCTRRRSEGQNILAGMNAGFFDTHEGILRGFHVEDGQPVYINNPDVVNNLTNHKWGLTVFKDGTASCGVKKFTGKIRTDGKEFNYYSLNDTILRRTSADYQVNLYTWRYRKKPYSDHPELVNTLASDALYVVCRWDNDPMTVNTGYSWATVTDIRDGGKGSISTPQLDDKKKFAVVLSGETAEKWRSFIQVGSRLEVNCTITVDGVAKPILTQVSTMYQLMTDGRDASDTPGSSASLYSKWDPMTFPVVSKDGKRVWLVQVDGRNGWTSMGVKGYEMYRIAKKLGGWWMTRFDGGGSSCTWVWNGSSGSIVNHPSDSPGGERSCMNYLLIRAK